jgi:hypothetical protein
MVVGKEEATTPQSQLQFSGVSFRSAPADMYMALGKNDQIYIIPSKNMVVIRMGDAADNVNGAIRF